LPSSLLESVLKEDCSGFEHEEQEPFKSDEEDEDY